MTKTRRVVLALLLPAVAAGLALAFLVGTPGSPEPGSRGAPDAAGRGVPALRGRGAGGAGEGALPTYEGGTVAVAVAVDPPGTPVRWRARLFDYGQWHLRGGEARAVDEARDEGAGLAVLRAAEPGHYLVVVTPTGLRGQEHAGPVDLGPGVRAERRVTFLAPARIRGRVSDVGGDVHPAVTVHLRPHPRTMPGEDWTTSPAEEVLRVVTGPDGEFLFEGLDPGRDYDLGVVVPGYVPARRADVRARPAEEKRIDLLLEPAAVIEGVLVDVRGEPLSGVSVAASRIVRRTDALVLWGEEGTATTGPDGSFHLDALRPGRKRLFAVVTYEAGLTEVAQWIGEAPASRVTALDRWGVRPGEVRLRLLRADGTPPSASRVRVGLVEGEEAGPPAERSVWTLYVFPGPDGIARVRGLPAGRLLLLATDTSVQGRAPRPCRDEVAYPGGDLEHEIRFDPPAAPTGGEEEIAVEIECVDHGGHSLLVVAADGEILGAGAWGRRPADDRRRRTVRGRTGTRALALFVSGGRYVEREVLFDASSAKTLTLEPRHAGGRLAVRVLRAGRGVASQVVTLHLPGWKDALGAPAGRTDADGRFVLDGLPTDRDWEVALPGGPRIPVVWDGDEGTVEIALDD